MSSLFLDFGQEFMTIRNKNKNRMKHVIESVEEMYHAREPTGTLTRDRIPDASEYSTLSPVRVLTCTSFA